MSVDTSSSRSLPGTDAAGPSRHLRTGSAHRSGQLSNGTQDGALLRGSTSSSILHASTSHHPYRIEVCAVTPISVLLLWSLRPPPLSAIPRNGNGTSSIASNTASQASASPPQRRQRLDLSHPEASNIVSTTRGPNRKSTKVTLLRNPAGARGHYRDTTDNSRPPNPASSSRLMEDSGSHRGSEDGHAMDDNISLDDDDDARYIDDIDGQDGRGMDAGISVTVNGMPWTQVMTGEASPDEYYISIYDLPPGRTCEITLTDDGVQERVTVNTSDNTIRGHSPIPSQDSTQNMPALLDHSRGQEDSFGQHISGTQTPPMQDPDTEQTPAFSGNADSNTSVQDSQGSSSHAAVSASALQASIRKARKDASRAESAMRHEIEAIKRSLDRMSDVDHRGKQKLLALQESIRQATLQSKSINEEAIAIEEEREHWEEQERQKAEELESVKQEIEGKLRSHDGTIKADNDEVAALEKELSRAVKIVDEKRAAKDKLENERVVELEQELNRLQNETDQVLKQPLPQFAQPSTKFRQYGPQQHQFSAPPFAASSIAHPHESNGLAPPQAVNRGGGRGRGVLHRGAQRGAGNSSASWRGSGQSHLPSFRSVPYSGAFLAHGTSSSDYTSDDVSLAHSDYNSIGGHASMLDPHKPEFVPLAGHAYPASASPSMVSNRLPFTSLGSGRPHSNNGHPGFTSQGTDSYDDEANQSGLSLFEGNSAGMPSASGGSGSHSPSTWHAGRASAAPYWNQATSSGIASSPHLGQDIWAVNGVPSPQHRGVPFAGGLPTSSSSSSSHARGPVGSPQSNTRLGAHGPFASASAFAGHSLGRPSYPGVDTDFGNARLARGGSGPLDIDEQTAQYSPIVDAHSLSHDANDFGHSPQPSSS